MKMSLPEKVLLGLASFVDYVDYQNYLYLHRKIELFSFLDEPKRNTYESAVKRLISTKDIEKVVEKGDVYLKITSQGWDKIKKRYKLTQKEKSWDKKWRVLMFDIPEKRRLKRDYLRIKLYQIGFGHLQKSVWVSPFDVIRELEEFLEFNHLEEGVVLFEARNIGGREDRIIAQRAWPLFEIAKEYDEILQNYDSAKPGAKEEFINQYISSLKRDPCLPKALLPDNWPGEKARALFLKITTIPNH